MREGRLQFDQIHLHFIFNQSSKMRIDFLNLPEKAMDFVCSFLDGRSLMRMRMVNHSTQEFMDFDSMKHIKTEINCMKMDLRILNPRNHIDMDLYIICPLDRALWKNCINFLLKKLNISNGFQGFNSHSLYYRVVNTDLQKLLDRIKPILEKETVNYFQIRGFDLALTRVCNALLEGMHVPYFLFEIDQLTMPHLNLFCEMVRQNTASSVKLDIEKLNCDKETIQGLSRMFELTRKIFLCFGEMQYSKAHPDILSVVQHLMLEHCMTLVDKRSKCFMDDGKSIYIE
ncbi:hypothetical protein PRIPAC_71536 [Pristionchus pacificus]|uniref:Uncharacterized protein n=1 Tax=Pristionchus pacificus TaxID=54126 RepID=A0A2A6C7J1_PRIPA|nr:hypothetical protein PRIPAC_71536 [Pristionchus pacificus]|eukprot:PDM74070.1 hypothetical protein PRIPAC_41426 [Pristionchus pacificus]